MHWVSASTSAGSTAGNMPMRSWLRPSLRYESVSTMPLSRSTDDTVGGIDAVEVDRADDRRALRGSATNGVAYAAFSAQP